MFQSLGNLEAVPHASQTPCLEGVIVGGGISWLSVAHRLGLAERPSGWELWEATGRHGGTIATDRMDGYSVDWGPNWFLDREPLTLQLVEEVGLTSSLEPANASSMNRFIVKRGRLIGNREAPSFVWVYRWQRGILQYTVGHIERREHLEKLAGRRPGLHILGNAYYGVGLNDCVKMAHRVAGQIRALGCR
jgi:protoporphyrinogen oxidase